MCGGAAPDHHCHLARVQVELLASVTKFYPLLKLRVFVDDFTALLMEKHRKVHEMAKKVMVKLKTEVERGNESNDQ